MKVKNIMTRKVDFVSPEITVAEAARHMRKLNIGFLLIAENDRLIGTLTDRDIVITAVAMGKDVNKTLVRHVMSVGVLYCSEDDDIEEAAHNLGRNQVQRMPVLNDEKRLVGVISLCDLCVKGSKHAGAEALYEISQRAFH